MINQIFCHYAYLTYGIVWLHFAQHFDKRIEVRSQLHLFDVLFATSAVLDLLLPIHIVKLIYVIIGLGDTEG